MPEAPPPPRPEPRPRMRPKVESLVKRGAEKGKDIGEKVKGFTELNIPRLKGIYDKLDTDKALEVVRNKIATRLRNDKISEGEGESDFDTQWNKRNIKKLADGNNYDVRDITPENPSDQSPAVFISGWNNPWPPEGVVRELVKRGKRVVFIKGAHGKKGAEQNMEGSESSDIVNQYAGSVKALIEDPEMNLGPEVDLIGYSYGAIPAVAAAGELSQVKRLVLCNPEGMQGQDSTARVAGRFLTEMVAPQVGEAVARLKYRAKHRLKAPMKKSEVRAGQEKTRQESGTPVPPKPKGLDLAPGSVSSTILNPIDSAKEVMAMGATRITQGSPEDLPKTNSTESKTTTPESGAEPEVKKPAIITLEDLAEKGVKTTVIGGNFDNAVPMAGLQQEAHTAQNEKGHRPNVVGFVATTGTHSPGGAPEGALINHVLTSMAALPAAA